MRAKDLKALLRAHLDSGSCEDELGSIIVVAPPGVGKSDIVNEVARENGGESIDFRLLLRDPTDLKGQMMPDIGRANALAMTTAMAAAKNTSDPEEALSKAIAAMDGRGNVNGLAHWLQPSDLPHVEIHGDKGILFFDDLHTAPPLVQAAAYQISIRPHRLAEYQLPERWVIVAAANRAEDRGPFHKMPPALVSRFKFVNLDVSLDDWMEWALPMLNPMVPAFMKSSASSTSEGHLLHQFDPSRGVEPYPCPRSWEGASRVLDKVQAYDLGPRVEEELLQGTVGRVAATQFQVWRRVWDRMPDPEDILVHGREDLWPDGMDVRYALCATVVARAEPSQYGNVVRWIGEKPVQFAAFVIKALLGRHREAVMQAPGMVEWARKHHEVVVA